MIEFPFKFGIGEYDMWNLGRQLYARATLNVSRN